MRVISACHLWEKKRHRPPSLPYLLFWAREDAGSVWGGGAAPSTVQFPAPLCPHSLIHSRNCRSASATLLFHLERSWR